MLEYLAAFLAGLHTLGAAIGAGGALYAEVIYTKSMQDNHIDAVERRWFSITYKALSWGMFLVLVTGIALIIVQFFLPNSPQDVLYAPLWMQNTLAFVITIAAWFMSRRAIPWWFGSSLIFTGWWMMLALDAWQALSIPYLSLVFLYIISVFIAGGFWEYMRILIATDTKTA